jgi:hypothetical protein
MKNKMLQPPLSQLLRKTISLNTSSFGYSSQPTSSSTASPSSSATESTSLLIESTEFNYCKKSVLITTPVEKESVKTNEIETQTLNIEYKDSCVQTETEIIPSTTNDEEENIANEEYLNVKIELFDDVDIYNNLDFDVDNIPFKEVNNEDYYQHNDIILDSPLPSIRSLTPPARVIKRKKRKSGKYKRKVFKLSRKYLKQAIKILKNLNKKRAEELYSNISTTPAVSPTRLDNDSEEKEDNSIIIVENKQEKPPIQSLLSIKLPPIDERTLNTYWDCLYFAFIFLDKGSLNIKDALRDLRVLDNYPKTNISDCKKLKLNVTSKKDLENPCDPTDLNSNFIWNYKSSKHYKLLKLKNSFVTSLKFIHDLYIYNSKLSERDENELNIVDCIKIECSKRIDSYNRKWIDVTNSLIQSYTDYQNKQEINDENDLNKFIENGIKDRNNNNDKYSDEIERCALKLYYFLNLIVIPFNQFKNEK